jgi:hypothetical protein
LVLAIDLLDIFSSDSTRESLGNFRLKPAIYQFKPKIHFIVSIFKPYFCHLEL